MASLEENLVGHLAGIRDRCARYHNHKENAAWAAVVLYVALAASSLKVAPDLTPWGRLGLATFLLVIAGTVAYFVRVQNRLRHLGFEAEAACERLTSRILAGVRSVTAIDCAPADESVPALLRLQNAFRFPRCLIEEIALVELQRRDLRGRLLATGYVIVWVSWAAAVSLLLVPALRT